MSRPDSAGESLESILASIRKSLSEQSTDVLEDELAAPADIPDAPEVVMRGDDDLPQPMASTLADAPPAVTTGAGGEAHSGPVHERPGPVDAASAPASTRAAEDPLWFLSRGGDTMEKPAGHGAAHDVSLAAPLSEKRPPAAEPRPPRAGVVRGPLPPFFGSSAEAAKIEAAPVPGLPSGTGVMPPVFPEPITVVRPSVEPEGVPRVPAGSRVAMAEAVPNGKANSLFGHAAVDAGGTSADGSPQIQALEVMVAELLRPMLRRWLDENMPRLVSAALKAEAALMSERDSKKP